MQFAFVDAKGFPLSTGSPSNLDDYPEGAVFGDQTVRYLPEGHLSADEIFARWRFVEGEGWTVLPERPGEHHKWDEESGQWVIDKEAKSRWLGDCINPLRDRLERAPVRLSSGHLIDIDERAEKRMSDALEMWDALGVTTLPWTLGDNTVLHVDKAQLQRFYDEGRQLRALRSLQLHTETRALKDNLGTTQEDIDAWAASYA